MLVLVLAGCQGNSAEKHELRKETWNESAINGTDRMCTVETSNAKIKTRSAAEWHCVSLNICGQGRVYPTELPQRISDVSKGMPCRSEFSRCSTANRFLVIQGTIRGDWRRNCTPPAWRPQGPCTAKLTLGIAISFTLRHTKVQKKSDLPDAKKLPLSVWCLMFVAAQTSSRPKVYSTTTFGKILDRVAMRRDGLSSEMPWILSLVHNEL